ncbi:MAG: hypothetical protein MUF27_17655 [Acidobacteria bacterium]|nr:hypothetical protein [Acidobacteriota bacterium]
MPSSAVARTMILLVAMTGCAGPEALFPAEVDGWTPAAPEEAYAAATLHQYIDGAAEVYLALGVVGARAVRYARDGQPEIIADVFDMGTGAGAYGAFHHDVRSGRPAGIGAESDQDGGALAFWKGRHFVSVIAVGEGPGVPEAVAALGRRIAAALPDGGGPPAIAARLPEPGLDRSRVHLVTNHALLNRHFFVADGDLFGFGPGVLGIVAAYRADGPDAGGGDDDDAEPYRLLLVSYPDPAGGEAAAAALSRFRAAFLAEAGADGALRLENGRWTAARAIGPLLAVALDAPSRETAVAALDAVQARAR